VPTGVDGDLFQWGVDADRNNHFDLVAREETTKVKTRGVHIRRHTEHSTFRPWKLGDGKFDIVGLCHKNPHPLNEPLLSGDTSG